MKCFINIFRKEALKISKTDNINDVKKIIVYAIGLSFLNPHAILDTLVIVGSVSSSYAMHDAINFCIGLIIASATWFFAISLFANWFSRYLAKPIVWKMIDLSVSIICFKIAYNLAKDIIAVV
jgi:L-lysine exporter family protein LysE/ArgO